MRIYKNPKIYTFRPEKEQKSFEISPRGIWILVILIILTGLIYFFLFSSYFKIKQVYIVGAGDLEDEVSNMINQNLSKKSNFFLFSNKVVEEEISENFSIFKSIKIYKGFPNALRVDLEKREAVLICQAAGNDFLIDSEGIVFKGENIPEGLPKIEKQKSLQLNEKGFSKDFIKFVKGVWENFPAKTHFKITKIQIPETDFVIEVYTDTGWKAIFDTTKDYQKQLDNLALVLSQIGDQKIEYIDLRLEEKVYYK